jgi:hypothetical protein
MVRPKGLPCREAHEAILELKESIPGFQGSRNANQLGFTENELNRYLVF